MLSDEKKRRLYDEGGEQALKEGGMGGGGGSPFDIFDMFFGGGGGGGGRSRRERRGKDMIHQLSVPLREMYCGGKRNISLSKNAVCSSCEGRGGKEGAVKSCDSCHGRGVQVHIQQIAPGMVQQMQSVCRDCRGSGETIREKDRCKKCKGKKVNQEKKILEVHIDPGMRDGQKIVFHDEGDQEPGIQPGDVIIVLEEQEDKIFKRDGIDLHFKLEIELVESLCGFKRPIQTLDNRQLVIESIPGEIIKPDDIRVVMNEGMPLPRSPFEKGRLLIHFTVNFPQDQYLKPAELKRLEKLLPSPPHVSISEDYEEVMLVHYDADKHSQRRGGSEAYDEEEQDGHQRVQCATQ